MSPGVRMPELTMTESERATFLERVRVGVSAQDYQLIEGMSYALPELLALIEQDPMTLRKLRHLLFGPKTEKTSRVCPAPEPLAPKPPVPRPKAKGHGRTKAQDYTGARWVQVPHPQLKPGDPCPQCSKGAVREQRSPAIALRIVGAPPISATGYKMERLRCDTCGHVFTAPTPPQAGQEKYDPSVGVTVALLRYGSGMPHYRLARLQKSLGVPMPEST
jgi:transposase